MSHVSPTIGILGGTGALGSGLAYRWNTAGLKVVIGSRNPESAAAAASKISDLTGHADIISGASLQECAAAADVIVVAVPWDAHRETVEIIKSESLGKVILDVVSPLGGGPGGLRALKPESGSACQEAQDILVDSHVIGGFHHVSAVKLSDSESASVETDVMIVGDNDEALAVVEDLVAQIPGMRAIRSGKLINASAVEGLTANLISANRYYKTHAGVRVTGI